MAERSLEFQALPVEDRKTAEDAGLSLPWKRKHCLRNIFRMVSELRGSTSISMQQPSATTNERSVPA